MSYTINSQSTLLAWFNSGMTQDGNITSNFTIETTTWSLPGGSTGAILTGRILSGNGYTITLKNSGSNTHIFPGLFKLNGGTIRQLKISGDPTSTGNIQPDLQCSYLTNFYGVSGVSGTITQVWIDSCVANKMYFYDNTDYNPGNNDGISCIACRYSAYTISNCQIGRSLADPFFTKAPKSSGVAGQNFNGSISNCVIFIHMDAVGGGEGGIIGTNCGDSVQVSVSNCIVIATIQVNTQNGGCIAHQNVTRINVNNCYVLINGLGTANRHANMIFGTVTSANASSVVVQNMYILITGNYGNDSGTGDHVLTINSPYTVNLTNIAYPTLTSGIYYYTTGTLGTVNLTNVLNSYTSSTPNSTEPIQSFSTSFWDKSYTPPLIKVNQTYPWDATAYTIYNNPNLLTVGLGTPVITWIPSPSTLIYPSPLTSNQLNATANVAGSFVYNPPLGTILNIGASQTLNATFTPTDPNYITVFPTATVSVVQAPYFYIYNQSDLYNFLQNYSANGWYVGYIVNDISLNIATWTKPTTTFNTGITLDGRGKTITLTGNNLNWTGLFNLTGGTVKNFTYDKGSAGISFPGGSGASPNGLLFGQNGSIPVNRSTVDGIALINFRVPNSKATTGGFAGRNNNIDFMNCQLGTSSTPYLNASNTCGGFAPDFFTGSFTNCIAYLSYTGAQGLNGGFVYDPAGSLTFIRCRVSGILEGTERNGGFVANTSYDLYFNNCYSFGGINNDSGSSTTGGFVGNVQNGINITLDNCYYMATSSVAATAGTFVSSNISSGSTFYLNLYNTASSSTNITSSTVTTNSSSIINNLVPQYFTNSPSFTGFNNTIYDMVLVGSDWYVGGAFTSVNGNSGIQYLAKWNSTTSLWESVGGGVVNGIVYAMKVLGSNLYIGGSFTVPGNRIAIWNGTSFSQISGDTFNGAVRAIHVPNANSVFIGGDFTSMNGVPNNMRYIARYSAGSWNELGVGGVNGSVYSIVSGGSDGPTNYSIIFGGAFTSSNNGTPGTLNRLAYWASTFPFFSAIGTGTGGGVNGTVNTLFRSGSTIYIGGSFTASTGGTTLNYWGTQNASNLANAITAIGSGTVGFNNSVNKILLDSGILYAMGDFTTAGGFTMPRFAAYNASATGTRVWSSTSLVPNNSVRSILINGSTMYLAGDFTNLNNVAGTATISNVNRLVQIPIGYNKTNYSATGQPSLTTPPILSFNTYFTS